MHVIQRCPVMPIRPHCALDGTKENLSPARLLLPVPGMRHAAMQQSQLTQQNFYVGSFYQRVIMIRQHAPRKCVACVRGEYGKQIAREIIHALWAVTDVMAMLETRGRNEKSQMPKVGPVRRRMPWIPSLLAPGEQLRALLLIELTPEIAWGGHGSRLSPAA